VAVDEHQAAVADDAAPRVLIQLLTTPGAAQTMAGTLQEALAEDVAAAVPSARWVVRAGVTVDVPSPATMSDLLELARLQLLRHDADLAVMLTDLPIKIGRRPVRSHASPTHRVGIVSLPALGPVQLHTRARDALLWTVRTLIGAPQPDEADDRAADDAAAAASPDGARRRATNRMRRLVWEVEPRQAGIAFVARVFTGNLQLLAGMVRANQPWRLAIRLSRALTGAAAAAVLALVTSDIWRLADALGPVRLALSSVVAAGALCATLIVTAGLWERSPHAWARQQVTLFNMATTATVALGVLAFSLALFALTLLGALVIVPRDVLANALDHPVAFVDLVQLAWFVSALATVGGALGAGFETDETVRQAAYANRIRSGAAERSGDEPAEP
jgi:hypothetical protein